MGLDFVRVKRLITTSNNQSLLFQHQQLASVNYTLFADKPMAVNEVHVCQYQY